MVTDSSYIVRAESFNIENPDVSVETVSSNVKVMESLDGKCHVEISARTESAKHRADMVDVESNNRKIWVRVDKKSRGFRGFNIGGSTDLLVVIKLPKTGALTVKTVSADVEVNQALLNVQVGSVSGNIDIFQNPQETCILKTVSGDITTHTFSACQYSLKSVSGDINVHVAPGLEVDVDGKTVSGDLESEISLNSGDTAPTENPELVTINSKTVSGNFILARN